MGLRSKLASFFLKLSIKLDKNNSAAKHDFTASDEVVLMRSMLSHNVRMPLSIISGYGNIIENNLIKSDEEMQNIIHKISGNIKYLSNVLSLIIDGNERIGLNLTLTDINLTQCVREISGYLSETSRRYHLTVQVNAPKEDILMKGDYTQLMKVLFNLFENSVKYMKKSDGLITITLEKAGDTIYLIYKDNGIGMNPEEGQHILEKGYKGTNSTFGTGMGLYYVNDVITAHGGSIEISTGINKGMCVKMIFTQAN